MTVTLIENNEQYAKFIGNERISVVLFAADWAEQCKQVQDILQDLTSLLSDKLQCASINAEQFAEISANHQIDAVPTVIFFSKGTALGRVDGCDVAAITAKCKSLCANASTGSSEEPLEKRLQALITKAPLMIFMKGDRNAPRCGFSKQIIAIVNETGLPYETFDILNDEEVRQGLKTYSNWPTYPQVYVKGELIGGLDIIKELLANNELESALKG